MPVGPRKRPLTTYASCNKSLAPAENTEPERIMLHSAWLQLS